MQNKTTVNKLSLIASDLMCTSWLRETESKLEEESGCWLTTGLYAHPRIPQHEI